MMIGKKLRIIRLQNNMTVAELSRKTGVSDVALGYIEKGRNKSPMISTLRLIAKAYKLKTYELIKLLGV